MESFEKQEGVSFLIIYYTHRNEIYYLPFSYVKKFFDRCEEGGRKSFRFDEIDKTYRVEGQSGVYVHFLPQLQKDINTRCWQMDTYQLEYAVC